MKNKKLLKTLTIALALAIPIMFFSGLYYMFGYTDAKNELTVEQEYCEITGISLSGELTTNYMIMEETMDGITAQTTSADYIINSLVDLTSNSKVKGIVLEFNSTKGSEVAREEIINIIKDIDKPIVSWVRDAATGQAFLIAQETGYIVASNASQVGVDNIIKGNQALADGLIDSIGEWNEILLYFRKLNIVGEDADICWY